MEFQSKTEPSASDSAAVPAVAVSSEAPVETTPALVASPQVPSAEPVATTPASDPVPATPVAVVPDSTAPTSQKQKPVTTAKKPILAIVVSVVFFVALCAMAYLAYSHSN